MSLYDWWHENGPVPGADSGPIRVGWAFYPRRGSIVFPEPERYRPVPENREHAKSASRCPAVINFEARYFVLRCPFDMQLRFLRGEDGQPRLRNMLGDKSPIRSRNLGEYVMLVDEKEWRHPDRPTVQIPTPYLFLADEPVYLNILPPFLDLLPSPWPGTLFGGRFPVHVWPRNLVWAFEWHDLSADLILRRGDPWFYVHFEGVAPERGVSLAEVEISGETEEFVEEIAGAVNAVNQTFSLFRNAEARRPKRLLKPRKPRD